MGYSCPLSYFLGEHFHALVSKAAAKVLLFFETTKFFEQKVHF
jgi:hypothetical protein